ncbi:hypothetical protein [Hufsiella ginkgonis]|uniref:Uncharacterized protein n=1 Tax=Hufsiella ginkgonis TaxID=2695274 RepID=A0A7K1Y1B3_9SPHI|nr:hypothetical protein [Hufsiella ginkgonis]MXV16868.1 hypothetical protein [Hufsiella ginkgonis]
MSKVTINQITSKAFLSKGTYQFVRVNFNQSDRRYEIDLDRSEVKEHIMENLESYSSWFDQYGFINWRNENPNEVATEMAASVWRSEWILAEIIEALTIKELEEAEVKEVLV